MNLKKSKKLGVAPLVSRFATCYFLLFFALEPRLRQVFYGTIFDITWAAKIGNTEFPILAAPDPRQRVLGRGEQSQWPLVSSWRGRDTIQQMPWALALGWVEL